LLTIPANLINPIVVGYCDIFFLALQANSQLFQFSSRWTRPHGTRQTPNEIEVFPDNAIGMIVDHREVCFAVQQKLGCTRLLVAHLYLILFLAGLFEQASAQQPRLPVWITQFYGGERAN